MSSGRLIAGLIIIAIGALFLLDSVSEAVNLGAVFQWWPMIIVIFGVWRLIAGKFRSLFGPLLLIVIGAALQLWQLDAFGDNLGRFWPIVLIAVGIAILAGGMHRRRRRNSPSAGLQAVIDVEAAHVVEGDSLNATLSTDNRAVSGDFQSGSINVTMGSGMLDLRHARIVSKPATLEASVVMGEAKVRVPDDWNVQIVNSSQMGETKDTRGSRGSEGKPDLVISGSVTMGSLQITD